jgi:hypothetical protein
LVRRRSGRGGGGGAGLLARLDRRQLRFAAALALSCGVIFGLSHLTGRGLDSWPEWVDKIGRHSHLHPVMDPQRIGVGRLVLHEPTDEDPWAAASGDRERRIEDSRPLKWGIQAVGLLLLAAALLKRRDEDAMVLMLFGVFLMLTLSRYYASSWVLLLFLQTHPGAAAPARWAPVLSGAALCLMAAVFFAAETRAGRYFLVNYEAIAIFVALTAAFAVSSWRRRARPDPDRPDPP